MKGALKILKYDSKNYKSISKLLVCFCLAVSFDYIWVTKNPNFGLTCCITKYLYRRVLLCNLLHFYLFSTFLDAIEIFFVNSHQNGATSWIPKDLPKNVKIILTFTKGTQSLGL